MPHRPPLHDASRRRQGRRNRTSNLAIGNRVDTRTKIISVDQAVVRRAQGGVFKIATGFFDPLLADHAQRLEALPAEGADLLFLVTDPPEPLLPIAARLELVAALKPVTYVVAAVSNAENIIARLAPNSVTHFEGPD